MSPRRFLAEHTSEDIAEWMAFNMLEHEQHIAPHTVDAQLHNVFGRKK